MPTKIQIPIPEQVTIYASANCHAAWEQMLTYETAETGATFTGKGEGVPMTTSEGEKIATLHDRRSGGLIFLSFTSSGNATPRVQKPIIRTEGTLTLVTVTSEDDVDDDNNDTYAMFWYNTGTPQRYPAQGD